MRYINDFSNHQYSENPSKKRGQCFFCTKKGNLKPLKKENSSENSPYLTFLLNKKNQLKTLKEKRAKRE